MDPFLAETILPYIDVITNHKFGLKKTNAVILDVYGGSEELMFNDNNSLKLQIPYGDQQLIWDFTFNLNNLNLPPDVFSDDGFFDQILGEQVEQNVPSLMTWNPNHQNCFLELILELIHLYTICQLQQLKYNGNWDRFNGECEMLKEVSANPKDLEMTIHDTPRGTLVELVIVLNLDLEGIPSIDKEPSQPHVLVTLTYHNYAFTMAYFTLSNQLQLHIGQSRCNPPEPDHHILHYIADLTKNLQEKVNNFRNSLKHRKILLEKLMSMLETAVLDADTDLFTRISFLLEKDKLQAVCIVELSDRYPEKGVNLSVIKMNRPEESFLIRNWVYENGWTPLHTAQKIVNAFKREVFNVQHALH